MADRISVNNRTALAASTARIFAAVFLDIPGDPVRAHDGIGTINFGGHDYEGVGHLGAINFPEETIDAFARGFSLSVSGVDSSLLMDAQTSAYQGHDATIYLGAMREDGTLIAPPDVVARGVMSRMTVDLGQGTGEINIECENRLNIAPAHGFYTMESQQVLHPGDKFFEFLGSVTEYRAKWGAERVAPVRTLPKGAP